MHGKRERSQKKGKKQLKWEQGWEFQKIVINIFLFKFFSGITVTNKAYSVITDVEITISPFNFQVTDGNSRLLNRVQMVTDGNKMVILLFVLIITH